MLLNRPPQAYSPDDAVASGANLGERLVAGSFEQLSEHYLDLLSLEWQRRRERIDSHACDFLDLCQWDARMQAYGDALTLIGRGIGDLALHRLADPLTEADLFPIALLGLRTKNESLNRACLALVQGLPQMLAPYTAALEWAKRSDIEAIAKHWPEANVLQQILILHALAHHEAVMEPREIDVRMRTLAPLPEARTAALRCALLRGEPQWAKAAREWLDSPDSALELTALEALIVFGETEQRRSALPRLRDLALAGDLVGEHAARKLLPIPCNESRQLLEALAADPERRRLYLQGLGWTGELAAVPVLSEALDDASSARLAAAVLGMLTGSDPVLHDWQGQPPASPAVSATEDADSDAIAPPDPDSGLPWPSRAGFEKWWHGWRDSRPHDGRYFAGQPRDSLQLSKILRSGRLAWRPTAAWLLQISTRGRRLDCADPAPRQRYLLHTVKETQHA